MQETTKKSLGPTSVSVLGSQRRQQQEVVGLGQVFSWAFPHLQKTQNQKVFWSWEDHSKRTQHSFSSWVLGHQQELVLERL